jgi:hypothetical protein
MFGGPKKDEYIRVVRANNDLRMKMEKLRIENALLKDQIRALRKLPNELSSLYIFIQTGMNVTLQDIMAEKKFSDLGEKRIVESLQELMNMRIIEKTIKDNVEHYSVRPPDMANAWAPKPDQSVKAF